MGPITPPAADAAAPEGAAGGRPPDLLPVYRPSIDLRACVLAPTGASTSRSTGTLAQVDGDPGAGPSGFWRRCAFTVGTCANRSHPLTICGAGPTIFSPPAPATIPSYTNNGPTCTKEQELNASNNGVRISENLSLEIRIRCRVLLGMGHLWMPDYDRAVYRYFRLDTRLERPMAPVGQMRWHRWQPTHLVPMIRG